MHPRALPRPELDRSPTHIAVSVLGLDRPRESAETNDLVPYFSRLPLVTQPSV